MVVMVAPGLRIIGQLAGQQIRHRLVRVSFHAAVQVDPRQGKGLLGAATDTPANQGVHLMFLQEPCQGSMAVAVGAYYLSGFYLPFLHVVELELFRMPKVLKYLPVLIGYRDPHGCFLLKAFCFGCIRAVPVAAPPALPATSAAARGIPLAQYIVSPGNGKPHTPHQALSQFLPGAAVDSLHRGASDPHLGGASFLGEAF